MSIHREVGMNEPKWLTQRRLIPKNLNCRKQFSAGISKIEFSKALCCNAFLKIEGIALVEGNFIDNILGRGGMEGIKGIIAEQDNRNHSISIRLEVNICYGTSIPEKAEEIQSKIAEEITRLTGLHVSMIHVVFKNVVPYDPTRKMIGPSTASGMPPASQNIEEDYNEEF